MIHNKDLTDHHSVPEHNGKLLKHTSAMDKLEHVDVVCLRLLVLDDGSLKFLASGRRTSAEYLAYLNKEGAVGCLLNEAAKLPMSWASLALPEGKKDNSLLVCDMAPIYRQDNRFLD